MSNCQELYDEMKNALQYFGLRFSEMNQVSFELFDGYIVFYYGNRRLQVAA